MYEYKIKAIPHGRKVEEMNRLGLKGWEAFYVTEAAQPKDIEVWFRRKRRNLRQELENMRN